MTDQEVSLLRSAVREHLGTDEATLDDLPLLSARFDMWRHISVQAALERVATQARIVGVPVSSFVPPSLAELLITPGFAPGPIDYVNLPCGIDETMACIRTGLLLGEQDGHPVAVWVRPVAEAMGYQPRDLALEVKSPSLDACHAFLAAVKHSVDADSPYRGKSLRLRLDRAGNIEAIDFEPRPAVTRDEVILPDGALAAIELHAIGVGAAAERLRAAGQHLKRGLLLYGPPGTGKSHTIRYLASRLPDATVFLLTGGAMGHIKAITNILSELVPAIVVLDDVDLVAEDRSQADNSGSTLFNLLDAMDGMRDDLDVLFVCTSNRAENLETAIAARPGRIDQAVAIELPDADCRRRLIELYGKGLALQLEDIDGIVDRTDGVTASFVKELLRRATLLALREPTDARPITLTDQHVHAALDALLDPARSLTATLLGVQLERTKHRGSGQAWCGV